MYYDSTKTFGYCPQSAFIITGNVYDNVVMGRKIYKEGVEEKMVIK